jgi:hypothetical protein
MHRSGTSCLTGTLEQAGVYLGERHTWNPFNVKGNRENQSVVDLHDDILAANGGSWDSPPARVTWSDSHRARALELLAGYADDGVAIAGFKDPRTLLVWEGWRELQKNIEFVGIFRHPAAVAESLYRRNQMPRAQAFELWYQYNSRLLRVHRKRPFPVLCFDAAADEFQDKINQVIHTMELTGDNNNEQFYDDALRSSQHQAAGRLPLKVRYLYSRLRKVSL